MTRSEQGLKEDDVNAMNEMVWRWESWRERKWTAKSSSLLACFKLN